MATKEQKQAVIDELIEILNNNEAVYLTDYKGMSVAEISTLRKEFRKSGVTYRVFKNKLVQKAMESIGGYDAVFPHLEEQTAFAFMNGDNSRPAKVLKEFLKKGDRPAFKAAMIEKSLFGSNQLDTLSTMKTKDEVIGDIIGLLLSPMLNVVSALQAQGSTIVGAIQTIAKKDN